MPAFAEDRGDRIDERLDNKDERINERLDNKGDRIEDRLDRKGDRVARNDGGRNHGGGARTHR